MLAVKSMDARDNFKSLCDKVFNMPEDKMAAH